MAAMYTPSLMLLRPAPATRLVRVTRTDLRPVVDPAGEVEDGPLYRELETHALAGLAPGDTVVVNLALVERLPSRFYAVLLLVRQAVRARGARLVLCGLRGLVAELFTLLGAAAVFDIAPTEAAIAAAGRDAAVAAVPAHAGDDRP